jgi:tRNA (guanine37-N1)-methyltransferase
MVATEKKGLQSVDLKPTPCPGMLVLDRKKFDLTISSRAIEVPAKRCTEVVQLMKQSNSMFSQLQRKPRIVQPCDEASRKLILLDNNQRIPIIDDEISERTVDVKLTYENWSASQIIRAILPPSIEDTEVVSGFEIVGHIAHLNLKECHQPYRFIIGQVILDKNPSIRTVVNKLNTIHTEYRYFDMELLAGEDNFITTAIEHKIKFRMDFSKLYWNSRLGTEHKRVVDLIPSGSIVLDMFCGIGPFALPLAKKKCFVHANDLNPESYKYLLKNIEINHITQQYITCYNQDGREFVEKFTGQIDFVIMNLPASAYEFLDVFMGLYSKGEEQLKPPTVFCYHFADTEAPVENSINAISEKMGCPINPEEVYLVRKTAPKTWMTCVRFTIPNSVLFSEHQHKKMRLLD